ncbi:hypothetical protein FKW77_006920 [Venturia effusa]|uniref:Zn(2)-C6 fungal-type domain-containing protein n=1 Tax=Venturia effusa TaxID=50376 RepID=A0A517L9I9_9PEZI|nr:hypothetical protein FKW77_006920 [Venturia effusa]
MQSSLSDQGIPAPYGRACTNCARVKTKCIFRFNLDVCERCHRLKKDCRPCASVRKRNANLKKSASPRSQQLLQTAACSPGVPSSGPVPGAGGLVPAVAPPAVVDVDTSLDRFYPFKTTVTGCCSLMDDISAHNLPDDIADQTLGAFRHAFLPYFPVVYLPDVMDSSFLRQRKPFLWLVIMSLCTKDMNKQIAMEYTIRQIVSQRAVAEHEKNLDLLLGLIVYLAWFQFHRKDRPYLTMWTQIAVSLMCELEIHKPPPGQDGLASSRVTWFPPRARVPQIRTLEERRAILGTYIITSMVWTGVRQVEPIRWTPYLDEHVRVLSDEKESELDEALAVHVRCHVIRDQMTCAHAEQEGQGFCAPATCFIKALSLQLQHLRRGLPTRLQQSQPLLLELYATDIIIHETILHKPRTHTPTSLPDLKRLALLDSLLGAIERWFDVFHAVPNSQWIGTPFGSFTQYGHCAILLFKLTTLDEPGWEKEEVVKRANLLDILDRLASRLDTIPQEMQLVDTPEGSDSGLFFKAAKLIRGMRASFAAELNNTVAPHPQPQQTISQIPTNPSTAELLSNVPDPDDVLMLLADDPFMAEMFCIHGPFDLYD